MELLGPLGAVLFEDNADNLWFYDWQGAAQQLGTLTNALAMTSDQRYLVETSASDAKGNPHLFVRDMQSSTNSSTSARHETELSTSTRPPA